MKRGDKESFRVLIDSGYSLYFSFAYALVKDRQAAKDILQNVFLKLYQHRSDIDADQDLHHYLLKSVRFEVSNYLRLSYNSRRDDRWPEDREADDVYSSIFFDETMAAVRAALSDMPSRRRSAFIMSRVEGRSIQEIAAALGISSRTVEKHLELARRDIRHILDE